MVSVSFKDIPIGDTFYWNHKAYKKVTDCVARIVGSGEAQYVQFPQNFRVDITFLHAEKLGFLHEE